MSEAQRLDAEYKYSSAMKTTERWIDDKLLMSDKLNLYLKRG